MVDSLSLIYSELWRLQILEFQQECWVAWRNRDLTIPNSVEIPEFETAITRNISDLRESTIDIKVV